ncbi:hypothetical protein Bpla01_24140 [Burkholderia plantarii]|nr:hypothetical protein Bpla01_24140 [Burkholderia plantarii]
MLHGSWRSAVPAKPTAMNTPPTIRYHSVSCGIEAPGKRPAARREARGLPAGGKGVAVGAVSRGRGGGVDAMKGGERGGRA